MVGVGIVSFVLAHPDIEDLAPAAKLLLKTLEHEGDHTQQELIEKTALSKQSVYNGLQRLENRGFVERRPNWSDSRHSLFRIADAATAEL